MLKKKKSFEKDGGKGRIFYFVKGVVFEGQIKVGIHLNQDI